MDFQFQLEIISEELGKNGSLLTHEVWDKTRIVHYMLDG